MIFLPNQYQEQSESNTRINIDSNKSIQTHLCRRLAGSTYSLFVTFRLLLCSWERKEVRITILNLVKPDILPLSSRKSTALWVYNKISYRETYKKCPNFMKNVLLNQLIDLNSPCSKGLLAGKPDSPCSFCLD